MPLMTVIIALEILFGGIISAQNAVKEVPTKFKGVEDARIQFLAG